MANHRDNNPKPLTVFGQHCETYAQGCGAEECAKAYRIVLCRGKVPCDLLFIGEAPGDSEDTVGKPFVGPAGRLLDYIISRSVQPMIRIAFTNMVGCFPRKVSIDGKEKLPKPSNAQVRHCSARLVDFVRIARPSLIVCVGTFARDWLDLEDTKKPRVILPHMDNGEPIPRVAIDHPAYILRQSEAQQGLTIHRCIVGIINGIEDHLTGPVEEPYIPNDDDIPF